MARGRGTVPAGSSDVVAPLRAMINLLPPEALAEVARALHVKLTAPPTPAERRVKGLGFLAGLLEQSPQYPENLPYVPRRVYDARRAADGSVATPSARLVERFGSWAHACHAAWGLLDDGRSWGPGEPWPRPPRHPRNYEAHEAVASVRSCAAALGHIPSSAEYHGWVINRRARGRTAGESTRPFVHYKSVLRLLAPDRSGGNGWQLARRRIFDQQTAHPAQRNRP